MERNHTLNVKMVIIVQSLVTEEISMSETHDSKTPVERMIEIGIALSSELDLEVLLEKIVSCARDISNADAGTLYLLEDEKLHFKIMQNQSMGIFKGGRGGEKINLEPVPMQKSNVSAYAAILGETVCIEDVYRSEEFDFSGPRRYDAKTGYRSQSMLVVPMKNHLGQVIGVLQLLNAMIPGTNQVGVFSDQAISFTEALASQAAVAITNATLVKETKDLFESFIKVLAVAIDAKSHSTRNHIQRVAIFNLTLAEAINEKKQGPFANIHFSDDELEEIRYAGWLHDVGKVTTPVWVMEKKNKLDTPLDRMELIRTRFELVRKSLHLEALKKKMDLMHFDDEPGPLRRIDQELEEKISQLEEELDILEKCNLAREFLDDNLFELLQEIGRKSYHEDGGNKPYLTKDEVKHLSVRKGNLTTGEIEIMRDHIVWTKKILHQIPFSGHLQNVALYAGQHHEKLNGSGYPDGAKEEDIPLRSRILAVADMFEALTSKDRSYKKPMTTSQVYDILKSDVQRGELDPDVVNLVISDNLYEKFEEKYRAFLETAPEM